MSSEVPARPHWGRLSAAALAVLLGAADTYVVVLLLPELMHGVGLDTSELQRAAPIVSGFLLGYVALLPAAGRLSDLVGRSPVLIGCLLLFGCGAVVTATAHGLGHAVAGRLLQGIGAGGLVPATLALVADGWPAPRRALPLGVIGAVQEAGAVLGPLLGAAVLALSGWRSVFWGAAGLALLLAGLLAGRPRRLRDGVGIGLLLLAAACLALLLVAPASLVDDVTLGAVWVPTAIGLSPLALAALGSAVGFVVRELTATDPLIRLKQLPGLLGELDGPGLVLAAFALGGVVLAFALADPTRSALAASAPYSLTVAGLATAAFALRQRTAAHPLVPRGALRRREAVGSLVVSLLLGAALVAALVDVPLYARTTVDDSTQLDAALVLLRLLVAVPVGAVVGGWATLRLGSLVVAGGGLLVAAVGLATMAQWGQHALTRQPVSSTLALLATGLGFGLSAAPINAAALGRSRAADHGIVSSLVVVARTVGMLVGLSVLSAVGLRVFAERAARIPSPLTLCPATPTSCPAFTRLTEAAIVHELDVIFALAAGCAGLAAVACITFRTRRNG